MATQRQTSVASWPDDLAPDTDKTNRLAERFSALADTTRLHIVRLLMAHGEMCVCEFMPLLDLTQSNVSFHLKTLKQAGLVVSRKEGRWMLYSLDRSAFERFEAEFSDILGLAKWPERTASASCDGAIRRRLACRQEPSFESPETDPEGGNDNANQ